jgi:hypothetical protein
MKTALKKGEENIEDKHAKEFETPRGTDLLNNRSESLNPPGL